MRKNRFTKEKFLYNPETLQFENIGKSIAQTFKRLISFLLFSFVVAVIYYSVYSIFFNTLAEHSIDRENKILAEHLEILKERYKELDEVLNNVSKRDTSIYNVIFESKPADLILNVNSFSEKMEVLREKTITELALLTNDRLNALTDRIKKYSPIFDSIKNKISEKRDEIEFIPSILPLVNVNINSIGASVGNRLHPIYKSLNVHTGIDFAASAGSEVIATASGIVKSVETKRFSTGTKIIVDHENGYETHYLYLSRASVGKNARVKCGDVIGEVGNIGVSIPHLHYEVRIDGKIADPLNYFFRNLSPHQSLLFAAISSDKGQSLD